ncbi:hypothetical protein H2198_009303 [Neophaeococcomyces mojaviensis]|uniref:Uncharacterized protein n=1 Tax=Neophaeococcomyces mojaviensis TaxID=3383035 RepID=A0ACC2ZUR7_9EURO|nr:hypothetical protein H2198_009303 [Knufia sp. JES_112]
MEPSDQISRPPRSPDLYFSPIVEKPSLPPQPLSSWVTVPAGLEIQLDDSLNGAEHSDVSYSPTYILSSRKYDSSSAGSALYVPSEVADTRHEARFANTSSIILHASPLVNLLDDSSQLQDNDRDLLPEDKLIDIDTPILEQASFEPFNKTPSDDWLTTIDSFNGQRSHFLEPIKTPLEAETELCLLFTEYESSETDVAYLDAPVRYAFPPPNASTSLVRPQAELVTPLPQPHFRSQIWYSDSSDSSVANSSPKLVSLPSSPINSPIQTLPRDSITIYTHPNQRLGFSKQNTGLSFCSPNSTSPSQDSTALPNIKTLPPLPTGPPPPRPPRPATPDLPSAPEVSVKQGPPIKHVCKFSYKNFMRERLMSLLHTRYLRPRDEMPEYTIVTTPIAKRMAVKAQAQVSADQTQRKVKFKEQKLSMKDFTVTGGHNAAFDGLKGVKEEDTAYRGHSLLSSDHKHSATPTPAASLKLKRAKWKWLM